MNKKNNKNLFSENIEAGFLEIIGPQVANMFIILKKMNPDLEKEWKNLFARDIILKTDSFLEEMSEELKIPYIKDIRIENLKSYMETIDK